MPERANAFCEGLTGRHRHIPRWPRPIGCGPATGLALHGRRCQQPRGDEATREAARTPAPAGAPCLPPGGAMVALPKQLLRPGRCGRRQARRGRSAPCGGPPVLAETGTRTCVPAALQRAGAGWLAAECGWPEMGCGPDYICRASQALMASTHRASAMTAASRPRVERFMRRPPREIGCRLRARSLAAPAQRHLVGTVAAPRSGPTVRRIPSRARADRKRGSGASAGVWARRAMRAIMNFRRAGSARPPVMRPPGRDTLLEGAATMRASPTGCPARPPMPMSTGNWRRRFAQWLPNRLTLARTLVVLGASVRAWLAHRAASKGAALSFYMLFSLAPILFLWISIAGLFFGAEAARGEIFAQLRDLVGEQARPPSSRSYCHPPRRRQWRSHGGRHRHPVRRRDQRLRRAQGQPRRNLAGAGRPHARVGSVLLRARLLSFSLVLVLAFMLLVS